MNIETAGLQQQPFQERGDPIAYVPNEAQIAVADFLTKIMIDARGIGMLYGPESSGKTTACQHFLSNLDADIAVARIDGTRLNADSLLAQILHQFGYPVALNSQEELLRMIGVFAIQQTRSCHPPLIVIENLDKMLPGALQAVCELANLSERRRFALRFLLVSTRPSYSILHASAMTSVSERLIDVVGLDAMSPTETVRYLHTKLRAAGAAFPENIFPEETCEELHARSGGWPGVVDKLATAMLDNAKTLPIRYNHADDTECQATTVVSLEPESEEGPKLIVSLNGASVQEIDLQPSTLLIGRSERSDICIDEQFASKYHALLMRTENSTSIIDLNSENGTYVNSRRVAELDLQHLDVISLGSYRIKFFDARQRDRAKNAYAKLADTVTWKSVDDMRRAIAIGKTIFPVAVAGRGCASLPLIERDVSDPR